MIQPDTVQSPRGLALRAAGGTLVYGARLIAQAVYFVVLARILDKVEFGTFTAIWVVAGLGSALSSMGFQVLAMKTAAIRPDLVTTSLAKGLRVISFVAPVILVAFMGVGHLASAIPMPIVGLGFLAISEIVLVPILALIASWHQGSERIGRSQAVLASLWLIRLAALAGLILAVQPSLTQVIATHAAATAAVTLLWAVHVRKRVGILPKTGAPSRAEWLEGASFCTSTVALIAYTELNQTITMAIAGPAAAATLAVAYKMITVFSAPISVLCQAMAPRLMRASHASPAERRVFWGHQFPFVAASAAACAIAAWIAAHFIGDIFGASYDGAASIARMLAILPLITGLRMVSVYVLAAAAQQRTRLTVELFCMIAGFCVNWALIRRFGLEGAVAGTLIVESLTALALAAAAWRQLRLPPN